MLHDLDAFFDALFDGADLIELRFLPPFKTKSNQWYLFPGQITMDWEDIEDRNKRQDVYFGANPRARRGSKADDVEHAHCAFADFDHTTPEAALNKINATGLPEPTVLVNSGHGAHAYWRLEEPLAIPEWRSMQRGLIQLLGCDDKIHDAPRIMRLPGTRHCAKHKPGSQRVYCEIVFNRMTRHDHEDIVRVLPMVEVAEREDLPPMPEGECGKLPHWVDTFLVHGAAQGGRNSKLFDSACAMKGAGWPVEQAKPMLLAAADRCSPPMSQGEALQAIASAYSKERTPASTGGDTGGIGSAWQIAERRDGKVAEPSLAEPDEDADENEVVQIGEPIREPATRASISNVIEVADKEGNTVSYAKTPQEIVASLHEATGDWPRRAGGVLFVPGEIAKPGELPPTKSTRALSKVDELFAWIQAKTAVYWADGSRCVDQIEGGSRTSLKRTELYEHLRETVTPSYEAAEILPHEPPAPRTWYAPCKLPRAGRSIIREFSERLNWQSSLDRGLMEAALLTLFWGGKPGARPAFILSSKHGVGAGKTKTVEMITRVAGGNIEKQSKEDIEAFTRRLLSHDGMTSRAVLVDNVKTKMDIGGLEALITAAEISGHRLYYGHASRPNRLTWFVTANAPRLSHDLTDRSYNIHVGAQKATRKWQAEMEDWIDENRPKLVAACLEVLAGPVVSEIQEHHLDRWAPWQCEVLSRVEGGDDIAAAMGERRQEMDSDQDDAEDIADVLKALIRRQGVDPDVAKAFVEGSVLTHAVRSVTGDDAMSHRQLVSWINNRIGNGSLKRVQKSKQSGHRGYVWYGEACVDFDRFSTHIYSLPADFGLEDLRIDEDAEAE